MSEIKAGNICEVISDDTSFPKGSLVRFKGSKDSGDYAEYLDGHDWWYISKTSLRFVGEDSVKERSFDNCDPLLASAIKQNHYLLCFVADSKEELSLAEDARMISYYAEGTRYPYITDEGDYFKFAEPAHRFKKKQKRVKSITDLVKVLSEEGYNLSRGDFQKPNHSTIFRYMLDDCGKLEKESDYFWPEFALDVE